MYPPTEQPAQQQLSLRTRSRHALVEKQAIARTSASDGFFSPIFVVYLLVPIARNYWRYLRFWQRYEFRTLPFGLASAPGAFL